MNKSVLLCIRNGLMASGILKMFHEKDASIQVTNENDTEFFMGLVEIKKPDIVVIEVKGVKPFTLSEWNVRLREMRETLPRCKIAMIVDDENYPDTADAVKNEKANGNIDAFFYASSGLGYLIDAISSL